MWEMERAVRDIVVSKLFYNVWLGIAGLKRLGYLAAVKSGSWVGVDG